MAPIRNYFGHVMILFLFIALGKFDLHPYKDFSLPLSLSFCVSCSPMKRGLISTQGLGLAWFGIERLVGAILLLELVSLID